MSSGLTTNYSLPYPLSTDPVDVAGDIQDLADVLATFLTNPAFLNGINVANGTVATSNTTANVFNANSTTLNLGGAATTLNIGNASGQANFAGDVNVATGKGYEVNNVSVLTATILGSSVVSSSLTSVGTLSSGTWSATTIAVDKGGTGLTSYAVGDIVYASGATTLAKLADVATGNALISGGITTAPSWGKVGLTTHVSGTLPVANGGTGVTGSTGTTSVVLSGSPTLTGNVVVTDNSASPALRITQTGTGNAFVVEDESSTDATPFVIDASGNVGIGTIAPSAKVHVVDQNNVGWRYEQYNDSDGTNFRNFRARGTIAAPTAVLSGDRLGSFFGAGYNGSSFSGPNGGMAIHAAENFASGSNGTYLVFGTSAVGTNPSGGGTERVRIDSAGNVGIGVTSPTAKLTIAASTTSASSLNLAHGVAPTSPVNGDTWTTSSGLYVRVNGVTVGPLGTGGDGGTGLQDILMFAGM